MATTYLTRTGTTPTTSNKYTFSCWIKRGSIGTTETLFRSYSDGSNSAQLIFDSDDTFAFQDIVGGTTVTNLKPSNLFRDTGAWMNIIVQVDYTQAAAADRAKIFINGGEVSYSATTRQSQNGASNLNTAANNAIGSNRSNSSHYFTGSMSQVNFIDGTAYPATAFGSVNATSGIWKANSSPTVTYGNNGFFLDMANSSDMGNDVSGKANDFTVGGGILTQMQDTPDNNYPTVNINAGKATEYLNSTGLRYGNTQMNQSGNNAVFISTFANTTGKYYWEMLIDAVGYTTQGVMAYDDLVQNGGGSYLYTPATGYGYVYTGNKGNSNSQASYGASYTSGDYISVAFDQTNGSIWFAKNGVWQNNATTSEIGAGTTTYAAYSSMPTNGNVYAAAFGLDNNAVTSINYGNGTFGTTTLGTTYSPTVGDTGAKFKYNIIPTGFTAISTKGYNA